MALSRTKWIVVSTFGLAALAFAAVLIAQPPGGFGHHGGHGMHGDKQNGAPCPMHGSMGGGMHGPMGLHGLLRNLELTDAQREQVHTLMMAQHEAAGAQHQTLHTALTDLMHLALSDGYSDEAAASVIATATPVLTEMGAAHVRALHEVYEILTAEQRQQLTTNLDEMAAHFAGGHGGK